MGDGTRAVGPGAAHAAAPRRSRARSLDENPLAVLLALLTQPRWRDAAGGRLQRVRFGVHAVFWSRSRRPRSRRGLCWVR